MQVAQVLVVALLASAILHEFADAGESHKRKSTSAGLSGAKRATRSTSLAHRPLSDTDPDADAKEQRRVRRVVIDTASVEHLMMPRQ